jgi:hypothetical protein
MLPLVILTGQAGAGKDTIASFLVKNHKAVAVALADPMKRFAQLVFGFTDDQLWGPSASRNAKDERFASSEYNDACWERLRKVGLQWCKEVLPTLSEMDLLYAYKALRSWAQGLLNDAQVEGGLTPRKALQTLGTEWGRNFNSDMWIDAGIRATIKLLGGGYAYDRVKGLVADEKSQPELVVITDGRFRNEIVKVASMGGHTWKVVSSTIDTAAVDKAGIAGHSSEAQQLTIPNHFFTLILHNEKKHGLEAAEKMTTYAYESTFGRTWRVRWSEARVCADNYPW